MAIKPSDLWLEKVAGDRLRSGVMNNLFGDGQVDGATGYAFVVLRNAHASLTFTSPKLWLVLDSRGAAVAVAIADGIARAGTYEYPAIAASGLTYSTPTSQASGLALPTLAAGQKCLIAVRRILTSATTAYPETNRLSIAGSSPL